MMAKEWILNQSMNRWGLNKKNSVGPVSELIRKCAPKKLDDWDRLYNVDFFIEVNNKYIGIQIKPITFGHTFENHKWQEMQETTHLKFQKKFGGRVFIVFSMKIGDKKTIKNIEVIEEIKNEIEKGAL